MNAMWTQGVSCVRSFLREGSVEVGVLQRDGQGKYNASTFRLYR